MRRIGRRMFVAAPVALLLAGLVAPAALANHDGAVADCGSKGILTIMARPTPAGNQAPKGSAVLLFEEGGTLAVMQSIRNGVLLWSDNAVGLSHNNIDEVTCTYTSGNGDVFEITGVFTGH